MQEQHDAGRVKVSPTQAFMLASAEKLFDLKAAIPYELLDKTCLVEEKTCTKAGFKRTRSRLADQALLDCADKVLHEEMTDVAVKLCNAVENCDELVAFVANHPKMIDSFLKGSITSVRNDLETNLKLLSLAIENNNCEGAEALICMLPDGVTLAQQVCEKALHAAVSNNSNALLLAVLAHPEATLVINKKVDGSTALQIAKRNHDQTCISLLMHHTQQLSQTI